MPLEDVEKIDGKEALSLRERVLACFLLAMLLNMVLVFPLPFEEKMEAASALPLEREKREVLVQVEVKGAVTNPGLYQVKAGEKISSLLERAGLLDTADTRKIKLESKIVRKRTVYVRKKKKI